LFWKKKKKSDLEFDGDQNDYRSAFRIAPDKAKPVIITMMGNTFHALNISGTGVCFRSHNIPVGTTSPATVRLPSEDKKFSVTIEVVAKQDDMCRCSFRKIHREAEDLLHAYVLEVQKNKIRQNQSC
jgi:hypothetical protein